MKSLMMFLMLWTGLITAVYIVDAAKLSRDAPPTHTDGSNIISADAVILIYYPYTAYTNANPPRFNGGETRWNTRESVPGGLRSGKRRL